MKKNGFTLIELLAIIVILAIIAVITVPIILNIIENSKRGAAIDSAYGYKDAIQKYYVTKSVEDTTQELPSGYKAVSALPSDFTVSGEKPSDGWIKLEKGQVVDYSLKFDDYVVSIDLNTGNIVAEKNGDLKKAPKIVHVGDEVCYGPTGSQECFKVISTNASTTSLFSNYNLRRANNTYKQDDSSPDSINFISISNGENYWHDSTTWSSPKSDYAKDINGNAASYSGDPYPYVYDSNSLTYDYVEGYLTMLKTETYGFAESASGRLLTNEEASDTSIFTDNSSRAIGKAYWLASANGMDRIGSIGVNGDISNTPSNYSSGVRPVIVVPTSDL